MKFIYKSNASFFLSVCFLYCCFFVIAELLAVKEKIFAWLIRPISYINMVAWPYKKLRVPAIFVQLSRDYICCHRIYYGEINFVAVAKQIMQGTEKNKFEFWSPSSQSSYFLLGWTSALGFLVLKGSGPLKTVNCTTVQLSTVQLSQ